MNIKNFLIIIFFIIILKITGIFGVFANINNTDLEQNYGYGYGNFIKKINYLEKIKKINFIKKDFIELKEKTNKIFFENLFFIEKILENNEVLELEKKYFLFLNGLKKYENNNFNKNNLEKILLDFLNSLKNSIKKLEKKGYFIKKSNIDFFIINFNKQEINDKIKEFNSCYLENFLKNKTFLEKQNFKKNYLEYLIYKKQNIDF